MQREIEREQKKMGRQIDKGKMQRVSCNKKDSSYIDLESQNLSFVHTNTLNFLDNGKFAS